MNPWRRALFVPVLLAMLPASAYAQASITGVVKDASGAVLPGVTVETASPVLIEKTRTAVTDESGQYRIVDLRAGTYTVTFTLTGFSTVKREGVELAGAFNAVINADLKVGALAETITVTAETPIVDTQSVRRQTTISGDLGEAEVGGPSLNVVPKTGGNTVKGSVYLSGVTKGMIGSNYSDDLKARGLLTPGSNTKVWDFNGGVGGPIKKDRLWFFYTLRDEGSHRTVPNMYANLNAGDPNKWTYAPDLNRPAAVAASFRTTSVRLTTQATPRNKFSVFWDEQM